MTTRIAYYLRHAGNLHYFASLKPYLDHFLHRPDCSNHLVVSRWTLDHLRLPEYAGYRHLFTGDGDLERYDLVITPTHLRDSETIRRDHAVQIFHGISDKPFTYARDMSEYALCLCAGQRQVDRLQRHEPNQRMRWRLTGYPKFDRIPDMPPLYANGRKTLIYCPTWRKGGLSSVEMFLDYPAVIEALAADYNLIVKPHPNIFNPMRQYYDVRIVERLERLPGVRLVRAGNVMPWLAQADLYIGDVSASGYEWLYFGKPAVFLNPQPDVLRPSDNVDASTYLWQCGEVCDNMWQLKRCVDRALLCDPHADIRERLLHYSVHAPREGRATARGVRAIEELLFRPADRYAAAQP